MLEARHTGERIIVPGTAVPPSDWTAVGSNGATGVHRGQLPEIPLGIGDWLDVAFCPSLRTTPSARLWLSFGSIPPALNARFADLSDGQYLIISLAPLTEISFAIFDAAGGAINFGAVDRLIVAATYPEVH